PSHTQRVLGEAQDPPFWVPKAVQIGGGAALGTIAPAVVEGVIRGTGAAINSLANSLRGVKNTVSGASGHATITRALESQLRQQGVNWSNVPQNVREAL